MTTPSNSQAFEVQEKLLSLEAALLEGTPNMPQLLRDIHRNLKKDPDIVTLLSEDECAILVQGLKVQTNTEISTKALKTGGRKSQKKMQVGTDL
jgi:hypothetical protein